MPQKDAMLAGSPKIVIGPIGGQSRAACHRGLRRLCGAVCALACLLPAASAVAETRNVLILNSYHSEFAWTDAQVSGAREVLTGAVEDLELYVEYMDTKRVYNPDYLDLLRRTMLMKYRDVRLDAIIATDDNALRFVLKHHKEIFGEAPVAFCGINDYSPALLAGRTQFTGVVEVLDIRPTIDLALKLHPGVRKVAVIVDDTPTGIGQRRDVAAAAEHYPDIEFTYLRGEDLSNAELLEKLRALPTDSIALLTVWLRDRTGAYHPTDVAGPMISQASPVPVYGIIDMYLGHGIVGGKLLNSRTHGRVAAEMALRILRGARPADIPVLVRSTNPYMFDHRQLERWGIRQGELPADSVIVHKPFSLYETYRDLIWGIAAAFVVLLFAVLFLATDVVRRRRAERAIRQSEAKYRTLLENLPQRVFLKDRNGLYISCNGHYARDLGIEPGEIKGKTDYDFHPRDLAEKYRADDRRLMDSGRSEELEEQYVRNGRTLTIRTVKTPVRDTDGRVTGILGVFWDITERKRAEGMEIALGRILEESLNEIYVFDSETLHFVQVNRGARENLGYAMDELRELTPLDIKPDFDADLFAELLDPLRTGQRTGVLFTTVHKRKDGSLYPVEVSLQSSTYGSLPVFVATILDITERKRAEVEQTRLADQLRQAQKMEAIGQLAGGVAHDFNNLLTSIMGNAQLLEMELPPDGKEAGFAGEIVEASGRAADLTRQLLAFSRKGQLQTVNVDVHEIVAEVVKLLSHSIDRRIEITRDLSAPASVVQGDPTQLQNAILNLAVNARDAMPAGGELTFATRNVTLGAAYCRADPNPLEPGEYLEVAVSDTGIGMDTELQKRIFEPFFTTKALGKGTGLGLASVYGCLRGHAGAIEVYSEPAKGSTFKVLLPLTRSRQTAAPVAGASEPVRGKGRILIIDDEESVRSFAATALEALGYTVQTRADGIEGVAFFRKHHRDIDMIMLDLIMPKLSGEDTFRRMKAIDPTVPVLIVSGFSRKQVTNALLNEGAAGFLPKPFRIEELAREVARHIRTTVS